MLCFRMKGEARSPIASNASTREGKSLGTDRPACSGVADAPHGDFDS